MNKRESGIIKSLISALRENGRGGSAFLGFDACIDKIVRVINGKEEVTGVSYFQTSHQFADYLISRGDKSCGIELNTMVSKLGGNMVITANALGTLGIKAECAGTFGLPEILPFYRSISSNCNLFTIGETITATALEFGNNKVILFDPGPYNDLSWESVRNKLGREKLISLIKGKKLVSFLNWSEIARSSEIWEGFLNEIIPLAVPGNSGTIFFTDLSDCSRRSAREIIYATGLLKRFRKYFKVALSLNHNEADLVAAALGIKHERDDQLFVESLFRLCGTDILVIHRTEDAIGYDGNNFSVFNTFLCNDPVILTGGGDNFNAGFCFALIEGIDLTGALVLGNAVAGFYVSKGVSPGKADLVSFLEKNLRAPGVTSL